MFQDFYFNFQIQFFIFFTFYSKNPKTQYLKNMVSQKNKQQTSKEAD